MKIPSPRARWASRPMSTERGPACSRQRALCNHFGPFTPLVRVCFSDK
jgi:hypothetical protein